MFGEAMKKIVLLIIGLLLVILSAQAQAGTQHYKTFEVVEVTSQTLVLQGSDGKKIEIDRTRRPDLKKGDKVRYDSIRNRLGQTLSEK